MDMKHNDESYIHSLLRSPFGPALAVVLNMMMAYVVYFIARVAYLWENYSLFSDTLTWRGWGRIMEGGWMFDTSAILYTNSLYVVMMLLPLWLKETRTYHQICRGLFVAVNTGTLAINLADAVYFPFTLRRTTTSVFREFDNESNLGGIFLTELWHHWYFVLLAAVVGWALWRLYVTPRTQSQQMTTRRPRLVFAGAMVLSLAIAVPVFIGGCRGGLKSGVRPITVSNANEFASSPKECALVLNTPFSLIRTIGKNVFAVPDYYPDINAASQVFNPVRPLVMGLPMNKKNVVILIVESFGREYIGALNHDLEGGRYKGYTPNVDRLIQKSMVFKHSFANGHKSIDGMPSVLCGIPMFVEPFILTPASMNSYTGLPGLLSKEGYETSFFHGANRGSMGFLAFANKIGFQHYYGRQDYAADKRFGGDADFDGNWGIWDEPFMQYYCTKMGEMRQPFMTAIFTVSSHHPFVVPEKYKGKFPAGTLPIHQCIGYTDMAIGRFFESASKQPWFKNTLFVLTSDHTNQSDHDEYRSDIGTFSAPIIIYDPSGEIPAGVSPAIAQQIDIMPTVLKYLRYKKPYIAFGCDMLHTPADRTYALNYINGVYQYTKDGYVLQWDGRQTKGIYALSDRTMRHNLKGKVQQQTRMERELKAIIYQYMYRMVNDKLMPR